MRRLLLQQTWSNFKLDFTTAHQDLRDTNSTVDKLGFSSANGIIAQIVNHLGAEVPVKIESEPQVVMTTPSLLSDNLPTVNAAQAAYNPDITSLMASRMSIMEIMRARLEESDTEQRDGNGSLACAKSIAST